MRAPPAHCVNPPARGGVRLGQGEAQSHFTPLMPGGTYGFATLLAGYLRLLRPDARLAYLGAHAVVALSHFAL